MPILSIALLGTYVVSLDDRPINTFAYDKVRALLAYLAVESDRPHRRERLSTLLWPAQGRRAGLQSLSQGLYQLRRALAAANSYAPLLCVDSQSIQFNAAECTLDVRTFTDLLDACHAHVHVQHHNCPECLARLEAAVGLYRGSFLEGFSLPDSQGFDEWALLQREHLHCLALEALRTLTHGYEWRGEYCTALICARRWLALEPWQEEAHCAVMRVLAASGQRHAALAQFETCREVLAAELAAEPGPETVALYARIRQAGDRQPAVQPLHHNLPAQLAPLIGRVHELSVAIQRLLDPTCRWLSLVGPGGCGKTRLATEVGWLLRDEFAGGVFLVQLAAVDATDGIVPAIAQVIGLASTAQEEARSQLIGYLRSKQMLLVLDNFEHLQHGAHLLVEVLAAAPLVKILTTSRVRLNCAGEQVIGLEGLALPALEMIEGQGNIGSLPPEAAHALAVTDAVALFLYHVRRVCSDYEPDDADLVAIARICHVVAGMPLAILLAAAWMDLLSPSVLAGRLLSELPDSSGKPIDLLAADWPDLPERQRSMRVVLDQACGLLSDQDQQTMAALSVLRGGFTYSAANAIAGATLRQLRIGVEKSWLHRTAENRYEIHELLRQYAEEKLQATPAATTVRQRHLAYFATALAEWAVQLRSERQLAACSEIVCEFENILQAWNWAVAHRDLDHMAQALDGICLFYDWRGRCQEGEELCRRAVEALRPALGPVYWAAMARLLAWHGWFSWLLGHIDVANTHLNASLLLACDGDLETDDRRAARAFALYGLGHVNAGTEQSAAGSAWEESLVLYRALGDQWGVAQVLLGLGQLAFDTSDYTLARRTLEESLSISQAEGRGACAELS
jgi:DNA-binding SARP family transcriptional activator/predicted ATPase